jgi:PAS domain S-box-containing protein
MCIYRKAHRIRDRQHAIVGQRVRGSGRGGKDYLHKESTNCMTQEADDLAAARREALELREALARGTAERQRIQNELRLRNAALDAATTHFMIVDARLPNYPIVYVNRGLATDHGYDDPQALIGQDVTVFSGAYLSEHDRQQFYRALADGETARAEMEITRPDGHKFLVGFSTTPLRNGLGQVTHYVTLGADITARREAERRKQQLQEQLYAQIQERERMAQELRLAHKLESVGRLAAGLAHEINTPIQYVGDSVHFLRTAFADLSALLDAHRAALRELAGLPHAAEVIAKVELLEAASDVEFVRGEIPRAIERTLDGADRVAAIVRAMKEFAYPDAIEQSPADLNHALSTTLTVARSEYKQAASVQTDFGELPPVMCNVGELNQVFLNLIVNAAHAIQDSGKDANSGCITISTRAAGKSVEIAIADNGCGIAPANLEKIFDPFFTTKTVGRGTGQGLAITRSIVNDKHGGQIDVHSTPGVGTRFVVRLPVHGRQAPEPA